MQTNGLVELRTHGVVTDIRQGKFTIRRTYAWSGHKIRVTLNQDPYEFQCDYYVELFNPRDLAWNRVHSEPNEAWYSRVRALSTEHLKPEQWENIERLFDRLVSVAQDLLEGVPA